MPKTGTKIHLAAFMRGAGTGKYFIWAYTLCEYYPFRSWKMPTISMFYGIIIAIYYEAHVRHNKPHIHARYQGSKASIAIDTGAVLAGELPA